MQSFILVGASHAFYLTFILSKKTKLDVSSKILRAYLGLIGVVYLVVFIALEFGERELLIFLWNIGMLIAPFFLIYTLAITTKRAHITTYWAYFIPYFLSIFYLIYLLLAHADSELLRIFSPEDLLDKPPLYILFSILENVSFPFFTIFSLVVLEKHRRRIRDEFSYTEDIDLAWLRWFSIIGLLTWLLTSIPYLLFPYWFSWPEENNIMIGFMAAMPLIFILGYFGYRQRTIFDREEKGKEPDQENNAEKYAKTGLIAAKRKALAEEMDRLVKEDKLYLQSKLSLDDLVECLGHSKHNISETINTEFDKTFYEYINEMRVQEFENKIQNGEQENFTLLSIAYDCGFNSKTSFNRVYKNFRGITPSEYIRSVATDKINKKKSRQVSA